ncbi:unnamed protein product [Didymodactylos carnosus]|uniref:Uncharacterized protein n=1 Tax=Didymodactylos carnosus TaxID=1234261 RepID=A0A814MZN7_9BILA|nr:unnamed protein product [Didymodactylos carnosus]CAF1086210.1 unnamed protein product [Didymodactylos carnosus]CAF3692517.1 unnamed protein product [Didymodactylos carnosus]CAF3851779.1 unnamed protein product [Didymodactylos carnosus]
MYMRTSQPRSPAPAQGTEFCIFRIIVIIFICAALLATPRILLVKLIPSLETTVLPPENALTLSGDNFFDYVRKKTNDIIVDILKVQEICSTATLLHCDDPLSVLEYDCDELVNIKRRTVFVLKPSGHAIKNGVKGSIKYLIEMLKEMEIKYVKKSKIQQKNTASTLTSWNLPNSTDQKTTMTPLFDPQLFPLSHPISTASTLTCERTKDNIQIMIESWYKKNSDEIELIHDLGYKVIVKQVTNNSSVLCHIKCNCGAKLALALRADINSFQLSSYYKRIRGTKCSMMCKKKKGRNDRHKCQQQQSSYTSLSPSLIPTINSRIS